MKNGLLISGSLETMVLKLLFDEDRLYGYQIKKIILDKTDGDICVTEGSLYPVLKKLCMKGCLSYEYALVNNRMRKYYQLTAEGEEVAVAKVREVQDFLRHLGRIMDPECN